MILFAALAACLYIIARMLDLFTREPAPPLPVRAFALLTAVVAALAMASAVRTGLDLARVLAQP